MKRNGPFTTICLMAAALLTACTQDGPAEPDTTLTEGRYPLQIDGITLSAQLEQGEASPQTRVSENDNGNGSVFDNNDIIKVCIGNNYENVGDYQLVVGDDGSITDITTVTPVYWQNTTPAIINAWYTTANESTPNTVMLNEQDENGLAYVLQGTSGSPVSYNNPATLTFTHQLAKVRVELTGSSADKVTQVEVYGYTRFSHRSGNNVTGSEPGWIKMCRTTYDDDETYVWEANLVPGQMLEDSDGASVRLNGSTTVSISGPGTLTAGAMHTIEVDVSDSPFPEGTKQINGSTGDISDEGDYYVMGTLTTPITITGGKPNIYLYNAEVITDSGPAISITGGASPTIHVRGENTVECTGTSSSTTDAGIYVAEGSSVTIMGSSPTDDELRAEAGYKGAGIGGYGDDNPCGDITIKNVMVYAYSGSSDAFPGIGNYGSCGAITIDNAIVYAYGTANSTQYCPAIGSYASVPKITISRSDIHAHRGADPQGASYADWIGRGGSPMEAYKGGAIRGTLTDTTVHKYKWNVTIGQSESEGIVSYDANGVGTEQ